VRYSASLYIGARVVLTEVVVAHNVEVRRVSVRLSFDEIPEHYSLFCNLNEFVHFVKREN